MRLVGFRLSRVVTLTLMVGGFLIAAAQYSEAQYCGLVDQNNSCSPQVCDASQILSYDACGSKEYELKVTWDGGVEDSYGPDEAYGSCYAAYYDCSDHYQYGSTIDAGYGFSPDEEVGDWGYDVHWTLDDWTVSSQSCNNGNPRDVNEVFTNTPALTAEWEVDCV